MKEISAQSLYHYTDISAIKSILKSKGFRYSALSESIPYKRTFRRINFAVCFCDLVIDDATVHRSTYGQAAIALSKEWGIRNGVTPVQYIHSGTPALSDYYMAMMAVFRGMKSLTEEHNLNPSDVQRHHAAIIRWRRDEHEQVGHIEPRDPTREERTLVQHYNMELLKVTNDDSNEFTPIIEHTFESLMWYITLLHNELDNRDSYFRIYEEQSSSGKMVRRYDEREWRAVFQFMVGDSTETSIEKRDNGKEWLIEPYTLKFEVSDITQIIVANDVQNKNLELFLKEERLSDLIAKIIIAPI
jgi:hypothetical protein